MIKRLFLLPVLLVIAVFVGGCHSMPCRDAFPQPTSSSLPIQDSLLTMLNFSESSSYYKRVLGYEFRAEDGKCTAYFSMANEEELYPVPVDQAWVDTLNDIVRRNNMLAWNGFHESLDGLLDGTSFSMSMAFSDGTTVSARGYGRFPEGYSGVSREIAAHFLQLLPEDMRGW